MSKFSIADAMKLPPTLSVAKAAEVLGCSRATAYEYARTGELRTFSLGGQKLVPTAWLLRKLDLLPEVAEERDVFGVIR